MWKCWQIVKDEEMVKRKQTKGAFQMKFVGFLQSVYSSLFLLPGEKDSWLEELDLRWMLYWGLLPLAPRGSRLWRDACQPRRTAGAHGKRGSDRRTIHAELPRKPGNRGGSVTTRRETQATAIGRYTSYRRFSPKLRVHFKMHSVTKAGHPHVGLSSG